MVVGTILDEPTDSELIDLHVHECPEEEVVLDVSWVRTSEPITRRLAHRDPLARPDRDLGRLRRRRGVSGIQERGRYWLTSESG